MSAPESAPALPERLEVVYISHGDGKTAASEEVQIQGNMRGMALLRHDGSPEGRAFLEILVRRYNAHEALVAACERAAPMVDAIQTRETANLGPMAVSSCVATLRDALTAARGAE